MTFRGPTAALASTEILTTMSVVEPTVEKTGVPVILIPLPLNERVEPFACVIPTPPTMNIFVWPRAISADEGANGMDGAPTSETPTDVAFKLPAGGAT
jgi:hypothetical protein